MVTGKARLVADWKVYISTKVIDMHLRFSTTYKQMTFQQVKEVVEKEWPFPEYFQIGYLMKE